MCKKVAPTNDFGYDETNDDSSNINSNNRNLFLLAPLNVFEVAKTIGKGKNGAVEQKHECNLLKWVWFFILLLFPLLLLFQCQYSDVRAKWNARHENVEST